MNWKFENDGGLDRQAFPTAETTRADHGLTAREYACIHLRLPNSGTAWLDELIAEGRRLDAEDAYEPNRKAYADAVEQRIKDANPTPIKIQGTQVNAPWTGIPKPDQNLEAMMNEVGLRAGQHSNFPRSMQKIPGILGVDYYFDRSHPPFGRFDIKIKPHLDADREVLERDIAEYVINNKPFGAVEPKITILPDEEGGKVVEVKLRDIKAPGRHTPPQAAEPTNGDAPFSAWSITRKIQENTERQVEAAASDDLRRREAIAGRLAVEHIEKLESVLRDCARRDRYGLRGLTPDFLALGEWVEGEFKIRRPTIAELAPLAGNDYQLLASQLQTQLNTANAAISQLIAERDAAYEKLHAYEAQGKQALQTIERYRAEMQAAEAYQPYANQLEGAIRWAANRINIQIRNDLWLMAGARAINGVFHFQRPELPAGNTEATESTNRRREMSEITQKDNTTTIKSDRLPTQEQVGLIEPTFEAALIALKAGQKVCRAGWNGKGMYLFLIKNWHYYGEATPTLPFIAMSTVDGSVVPWLASQTDILAEDWREA